MNNETKASSISDGLYIAMQDVEEAIRATEDLLIDDDEESQTRATAILACALTKFSELRKSFEQYVRQVEFGGRPPFDEECEALIRANPAKLLPQQMDWFRKFHHEHPEAARQFIESGVVVGHSAVPASESEGGGNDQRERRRLCLAITEKLCELPTAAMKAMVVYLGIPLPEAPKPVQPCRTTGHGGAKAKGRLTPNAGRKLSKKLTARA